MHFRFALYVSCCAALVACERTNPNGDEGSGELITMRLESNDGDADFEYCDANGVCQELANPERCAVLVITIDTRDGSTCQRCEAEDGAVISDTCQETSVQCTVVTLPEPDCVVCAYTGGAVVFSSCVAAEPERCVAELNADGSECKRCFDAEGRVTLDECEGRCAAVVCPAVACAEGFAPSRQPGDCCDSCWPTDSCRGVVCPNDPVPVCPPGSVLKRDPSGCCAYVCMPAECPPARAACQMDSDCAAADGMLLVCVEGQCLPACPSGFEHDLTFPVCGRCVPAREPPRYCESDEQCGEGELCSWERGCLVPQECADDSACACTSAGCPCFGVCRPSEAQCPTDATDASAETGELGYCEGRWLFPGTDRDGCPLPPKCVCADGTTSLDGRCADACATTTCPPPQECPRGTHLEDGFPYCCGACVPDDECWTRADACLAALCGPGTRCEVGPSCEATCVADVPLCASRRECAPGMMCTTEVGDCLPAPNCDPAIGMACPDVCLGYCKASSCALDSDCPLGFHCDANALECAPNVARYCSSSAECTSTEYCTTERGECLPAPECSRTDDGASCVDVCYGTCRPKGCFFDSDCAVGFHCEGESVCPPGAMCFAADRPGFCAPNAAGCQSDAECTDPAQGWDCVNGRCVQPLCDPLRCGPSMGMASYLCPDGMSWAGPTGRCLLQPDATCGWELLRCP